MRPRPASAAPAPRRIRSGGGWRRLLGGALTLANSANPAGPAQANLVGPEHVALGSGWDSGLRMAAGLDAAGLAHVSEGLRRGGLSEEGVEQARLCFVPCVWAADRGGA